MIDACGDRRRTKVFAKILLRHSLYQSLGYGHGFAQYFLHVDCPDGRLRGQVKAKSEAVYQRLMEATESASVTARQQRERAAQQQEAARRARRQPSVRDLFGAAGGGS